MASVALIDGEVVWSFEELAPQRASGALMVALEQSNIDLASIDLFAADIGPGSFSGVRVAVTIAKTLAWVHKKHVIGANAFDLVDPDGPVILPSKRGEWFLREVGRAPIRTDSWAEPVEGYPKPENPRYPSAAMFAAIASRLQPQDPIGFQPAYLIEPSISTPKKPFRSAT